MTRNEKKPRTAAGETEEEVRRALVDDPAEEKEDEGGGEAGDSLTPNRQAQEEAHGEN